jgi:hypothetical protein
VAEIAVTLDEDGRAYIDLAGSAGGEIRHSVALDDLADDRVPTLGSIVLQFDYFGRLAGIEVIASADSVLPPALLDAASPM